MSKKGHCAFPRTRRGKHLSIPCVVIVEAALEKEGSARHDLCVAGHRCVCMTVNELMLMTGALLNT